MAIGCGLCEEWQLLWSEDWNEKRMITMFYKGIDFFFDKRFMSNDFIKDSFDTDFLRENGILVDDKRSLLNPKHACILGESDASMRFNALHFGEVYVADNSHLHLLAKDNAFVIVRLIGNAQAVIERTDSAKVKVIRHDITTKVQASDGVKVVKELDWLKDNTTA